ncbi:hydrolase, partial [Chloroflexota bacterium]
MRKWEAIFSEDERELAKKAGWGQKQPFGKKPALVIIDVNRAFIGSQPKAILQSVEEYKTSCGDTGWAALDYIEKLLMVCRDKKMPVIYTTNDIIMK